MDIGTKFGLTICLLLLVGAGCAQPAPAEQAAIEEDDAMEEREMEGENEEAENNEDAGEAEEEADEVGDESDGDEVGEEVQQDTAAEESDDQENEQESSSEEEEEEVPPPPALKEISMTAKQFDFIPSKITVKKGDRVKLSIKSIDVDHGFSLSAFGINEQLEPDKTVVVEFVADKVGQHSFFCSIFCGASHGSMRGTLIVEEN
jgi:cytochrome c oxidase subunit II